MPSSSTRWGAPLWWFVSETGCIAVPCKLAAMQRVLGECGVAVYLLLAAEAGGYGVWVERGKTEIARHLHTSNRRVSVALDALADVGLLVMLEGRNQHGSTQMKLLAPECSRCTLACDKAAQPPVSIAERDAQLSMAAVDAASPPTAPVAREIDRIFEVYDHWNRQEGLVRHRGMMPRFEKAIAGALHQLEKGRYPDAMTEILHAITNYAEVLRDPALIWTHSWTIDDFLNRGLTRFLDEAKPHETFRMHEQSARNGAQRFEQSRGPGAFIGL